MWFKEYQVEIANKQIQELQEKLQQNDYNYKLRLQQEQQKKREELNEAQKERSKIEHMFTLQLLFFIFMWILSSTIAFYYFMKVTKSLLVVLKFFRIER